MKLTKKNQAKNRAVIQLLVEALKSVTYNFGHTVHHYEVALAKSAGEFLKTGVFVPPKYDDE